MPIFWYKNRSTEAASPSVHPPLHLSLDTIQAIYSVNKIISEHGKINYHLFSRIGAYCDVSIEQSCLGSKSGFR